MELRDFVVAPFYILLFTIVAYALRPHVTDSKTRRYFLPALWIRFVGAIGLGLIYQFYYSKGAS